MAACPRWEFSASSLYRCDKCGDVRCKGSTMRGSSGAYGTSKCPRGKSEFIVPNRTCRVCRNGNYRAIR